MLKNQNVSWAARNIRMKSSNNPEESFNSSKYHFWTPLGEMNRLIPYYYLMFEDSQIGKEKKESHMIILNP